jgi:excisionase family DNA binding protein
MRLMKVPEVADVLGLQPVTIRRMLHDGRLQVVRPTGGRAVRVRSEDVEALVRLGMSGIGRPGKGPKPGRRPLRRSTAR